MYEVMVRQLAQIQGMVTCVDLPMSFEDRVFAVEITTQFQEQSNEVFKMMERESTAMWELSFVVSPNHDTPAKIQKKEPDTSGKMQKNELDILANMQKNKPVTSVNMLKNEPDTSVKMQKNEPDTSADWVEVMKKESTMNHGSATPTQFPKKELETSGSRLHNSGWLTSKASEAIKKEPSTDHGSVGLIKTFSGN